MDDTDRKIIGHVQMDGRLALAELGARVGLSASAVNERLRKLQSTGAIRGWQAIVSPGSVGLDLLAFVHILLETPSAEEPFRTRIKSMPAVQECHHVTGEWSYLLKLRVQGPAELERTLGQLKSHGGVVRTHSAIALSTVKETSILPLEGLP